MISNKTIPECLWQFSSENNLSITFSDNDFENQKFSFDLKNQTLSQILDSLLKSTNNSYSLTANEILIYPSPNQSRTISGYIIDNTSGEQLIGANITTKNNTNQTIGTATNVYGFFSLKIPLTISTIKISYLGYKSEELNLSDSQSEPLQIRLNPDYLFDEIVITTQEKSFNDNETLSRFENKELAIFKQLPSLGGDVDIIRNIQMLPGSQNGPDGYGGLHVRGGNSDQNLVLLDGVPIYNPYHALGLYSIFDESIIKNTKYLRNYFPARYGGRLSSVLDVRTKDGNSKEWNFNLGTGLILSKMMFEGPIIKNKASFIFSARRTHLDPFLNSYSKNKLTDETGSGNFNYYFGEIMTKLNYTFSTKNKVFLSYYKGQDAYEREDDDTDVFNLDSLLTYENQKLNWGNELASLRWNYQLKNNIFTNLTLTYSKFEFTSQDIFSQKISFVNQPVSNYTFNSTYLSRIESFNAKYDLDFVPNPNHYLRIGISAGNDIFKPGLANSTDEFEDGQTELQDTLFSAPLINNYNINLYVEDDLIINDKLKANVGLFNIMYILDNKTIIHSDPRLSFTWTAQEKLRLTLSANSMTQYLHLLTRVGSSLPNDLWVPSTNKVSPQRAWMLDLGLNYRLSSNINISFSAYYKKLKNLISYAEGSFTPTEVTVNSINWQESITVGKGISKGIEMMMSYSSLNTNGWINYTFSDAQRQFDDINSGIEFPFQYNLNHVVNFIISHKLNKNWTIGGHWTFGSGLKTNLALREWQYIRQDGDFDIFYKDLGLKNSYTLPANHRLDVSAQYSKLNSWGNYIIKVGVYNAYNHKNIIQVKPKFDDISFTQTFKAISLVPILPYFSVAIKL